MLLFNSDHIRESGQKVPLYVRIPFGLVVLGSLIYLFYIESGPYNWMTNWQTQLLDGDYYPVVSFVFTIILVLTPALLIMMGLSKIYGKKPKSSTEKTDG
ncbi:MAG: hypothetical protein JKY54_17190 [Flavobacteriales bacterium]|nr:hypothetical protein [Flavobacteriales bacterium]